MNNQPENNKEVSKIEESLSKALNDLFDPFMKYFETQECLLRLKYTY